MTSIQLLVAKLAAVLCLGLALFLWGHHEGAAGVQASWDKTKAVQTAQAAAQAAHAAQQTLDWTQQFQTINAHYEDAAHAPAPTVADVVSADVSAGAVRLRDEPAPACPGTVSVATARSRAADAAATQALADRVANSIAAVRAGDAADTRERQLDGQIVALQALLAAERQQSPTP